MSPSHYAWLRYEDLQQRSKNLQNFNDYAWGIECALNYLLSAIEAGTFPSDLAELDAAVNRAISTGARLWRSRALALKKWMPATESSATMAGAAEAIIEFGRIARTVKKADEEILVDAGHGYTDREIADRHDSTPGAIRTRLSRLRHKLTSPGHSTNQAA